MSQRIQCGGSGSAHLPLPTVKGGSEADLQSSHTRPGAETSLRSLVTSRYSFLLFLQRVQTGKSNSRTTEIKFSLHCDDGTWKRLLNGPTEPRSQGFRLRTILD